MRDNYKIRFWRLVTTLLCRAVFSHPEARKIKKSTSQEWWERQYYRVVMRVYDEIDYQYGPSMLSEMYK